MAPSAEANQAAGQRLQAAIIVVVLASVVVQLNMMRKLDNIGNPTESESVDPLPKKSLLADEVALALKDATVEDRLQVASMAEVFATQMKDGGEAAKACENTLEVSELWNRFESICGWDDNKYPKLKKAVLHEYSKRELKEVKPLTDETRKDFVEIFSSVAEGAKRQ